MKDMKKKILHLHASPRQDSSTSLRVARAFLEAVARGGAEGAVETVDLFADALPEFNAPAAAAKYRILAGKEPTTEDAEVWKGVIEVVDKLKGADMVLISTAMWNFSIPYPLKHYFDVIVQPGLTFTFSPEDGYTGLVTGKTAILILSRGSSYESGTETESLDMQRPYLELILGFIGFTDIRTIVVAPTVAGGPEVAEQSVGKAMREASDIAAQLSS